MSKKNTLIIIAGPTAVGKTSCAIQLAKHFNTSIVSADSRQCYKELGVAVAKPSKEQLTNTTHYFINSHSIYDTVNAGVFEQYALHKINHIFLNNPYAVMVGGTGLYINALCNGIDDMPTISTDIRNSLQQQYTQNGLAWLQHEVKSIDPNFWKIAEQQNPHRLLRALEIKKQTGNSITYYRQNKKIERHFNIIKIGLEIEKTALHQNINHRIDDMVNNGAVNEAQQMYNQKHLTALQTVGYQEFFDYFDNKHNLTQAIEKLKINTRQYAKRQMTWFKKDKEIQWFKPQASFIINHFNW